MYILQSIYVYTYTYTRIYICVYIYLYILLGYETVRKLQMTALTVNLHI